MRDKDEEIETSRSAAAVPLTASPTWPFDASISIAEVGTTQTFVSTIERGVRRLDAIEFYAISRAMGCDPVALFEVVISGLPDRVDI